MTPAGTELLDWPLKRDGDTHHFGHLVALGLSPTTRGERTTIYAEFILAEARTRYRIPPDPVLVRALVACLNSNMWTARENDGHRDELMISKKADFHIVDVPLVVSDAV